MKRSTAARLSIAKILLSNIESLHCDITADHARALKTILRNKHELQKGLPLVRRHGSGAGLIFDDACEQIHSKQLALVNVERIQKEADTTPELLIEKQIAQAVVNEGGAPSPGIVEFEGLREMRLGTDDGGGKPVAESGV